MFTFVFALSLAAAVASDPPVQSVPSVDLARYAGRWYEIARYPNRFQDQCTGEVTATYVRRDDRRIDVLNRCRKADGSLDEAEGTAKIVEGSGNAQLKVRFAPSWLGFLPFVWGDYWVIGLDEAYRWAVVGTPDRKYLWLLSRSPQMTDVERAAAEGAMKQNGFDLSRLRPTAQPKGGRP